MKATIVSINREAKYKGKDLVELVTQGDSYKGQTKDPRTHRLFVPYANDLIAMIADMKAGDRVEYKTDDGQYKNMTTIEVIAGEAPPTTTTTGTAAAPNKPYVKREGNDITKSIARAASMKEATKVVLFGAKKTDAPAALCVAIVGMTRELEKFLLFQEGDAPPAEDQPFE